MTAEQVDIEPTSRETRCSYHPDVLTVLRCSRCGKPICPRCGVRTPVGMRCPDCAGVRGLPTYRAAPAVMLRAGAFALLVAIGVGVLWSYFPDWQFYFALALGFGVCETIATATNQKRGPELQALGIVICLVGLVLSRALIAQRLGVDLADVMAFGPRLQRALYLRPIPDLLFALFPLAINWIRFR
jgi:hypothetical protein